MCVCVERDVFKFVQLVKHSKRKTSHATPRHAKATKKNTHNSSTAIHCTFVPARAASTLILLLVCIIGYDYE